ncbi:hypothetical protein ACHAPU_010503 [Fusarium lateritium]
MESSSIETGHVSLHVYVTDLSIKTLGFEDLNLAEVEPKQNSKRDLPITELSRVLMELQVPGPFDFIYDNGEIASGAQFRVRQATIVSPKRPSQMILAAIKYPKFLLDAREKLDLSSDRLRRQIYDFLIEITALRHPALRDHPNIVHMIGWGTNQTWHRVPFIALELAKGDLDSFVKPDGPMSFKNRQAIIIDISSALSALHNIDIVHGDLKPGNVLIYETGSRWLARLTDFGGGAGVTGMTSLRGRGTVGWRAPELQLYHEKGEPLDPQHLESIDIYSLGLVIWFTICQTTSPPQGSEGDRALELALGDLRNKGDVPNASKDKFQQLLEACLTKDPEDRDAALLGVIGADNRESAARNENPETYKHGHDGGDDDEEESVGDFRSPADMADADSPWDWQIPTFSDVIALHLRSAYCQDEQSLSPQYSFGVFMNSQNLINERLLNPTTRDIWLGLLRRAALGGVPQAQALIFLYYERYGYRLDDNIEVHRQDWLFSSVATGALTFSAKARSSDSSLFDKAVETFQKNGGYNQHFTRMTPSTLDDLINIDLQTVRPGVSMSRPLNKDGDFLIHALCSFRNLAALKVLERTVNHTNINILNYFGESPLYRACLCGSLDTVLLLLSRGADPTIHSRGDGPSCLHWLLAFHPEDVPTVAQALTDKGASPNALSHRSHKMLHYPFVTPWGSPLHWAVEFSSTEAVKALLKHGADPWLPNGNRQFILSTGTAESCPRSIDDILPEEPILTASNGSSAVEVAVQNWDYGILPYLLEQSPGGASHSLRDGIGVFHHLVAGDFRWIGHVSQFYNPVMRGPRSLDRAKIRLTIEALLGYGFDINQLAISWNPYPFDRQVTTTSLMLAVYTGQLELAEELIDAGADVNMAGNTGRTALMGLGPNYRRNKELQTRVMNLLLSNKARFDNRDDNGFTPVLALAHTLRTFAVEVLLNNGASISDKPGKPTRYGEEGEYPLFNMLCSITGDKQLAEILRNHGVPVMDKVAAAQRSRKTLLHYTVDYELLESIEVLLDSGFDVNTMYIDDLSGVGKGKVSQTPLDLLLKRRSSSIQRAKDTLSKSDTNERRRFLLKDNHTYPHTSDASDNTVEAYNLADGKLLILALHSSCYRVLDKTTLSGYTAPDPLYEALKYRCTKGQGLVLGLDYNYCSVAKFQRGGSWWTKKGSEYAVMDP